MIVGVTEEDEGASGKLYSNLRNGEYYDRGKRFIVFKLDGAAV